MSAAPASITAATYQRLSAELAELTGPKRAAIADALFVARQAGKIEENADYTAVKEEERLLEDRIAYLVDLLSGAQVIEKVEGADTVVVGSTVTIRFAGDDEDETETYLVGDAAERGDGVEVCTPASPLGKALLGAVPGDTVSYLTPTRTKLTVEVVAIA